MSNKRRPNGYWTKTRIKKEANKFKYRKDWEKYSRSSHTIASKNGWLHLGSHHILRKIDPDPLYKQKKKKCYKCNRIKSFKDFNKSKINKSQVRSLCKSCNLKSSNDWRNKNRQKINLMAQIRRKNDPMKFRNLYLKRTYNLTLCDYNKLLNNQNKCCKICKIKYNKVNKGLMVDHCHKTGKVRGLLCNLCNRGLGHFKDSPKLLMNAKKYLELSKKW